MYVCMYVCMYTCVYIYMCVNLHLYLYLYTHVYTHMYIFGPGAKGFLYGEQAQRGSGAPDPKLGVPSFGIAALP